MIFQDIIGLSKSIHYDEIIQKKMSIINIRMAILITTLPSLF